MPRRPSRAFLRTLRAAVPAAGLLLLGAGVTRVGLGEPLDVPWPWLLARDLALVTVLAASAWGLGGVVARWWCQGLEAGEDRLARVAVGLGLYGVAEFLLGVMGWLGRAEIAGLLAAGLLLAARKAWHGWTRESRPARSGWSRAELAGGALLAAASAVILCGVVVPETFYDALYYHDAFPALYLRHARIVVFPSAVHSAMPSHVDLLYASLLAWGGASTVKVGNFALLLGTLGWIVMLGRRLGSRLGGLLGALALVGLPGVAVMAGLGSVDLGVTFFAIGCVALTVADLSEKTATGPLLGAAFLAGVAAGSKYSALLFVLVWGAGVTVSLVVRSPRPRRFALLLGMATLVLAGGGGWYLRNQVVLGNALYPALARPGSPASEVAARLQSDSGPPGGWLQAPRVLVDAALERRGMGAGAELWPGVLLLLAGAVWGLGRPGAVRWLAVLVVAMMVGWARAVLIVRYAYPALALAAALAGVGCVASVSRRGLRVALVGVLVAVSGLGVARTVSLIDLVHGQPWAFLAGRQGSGAFLAERVAHFEAARWVASHTPEQSTRLLLVGETQGYYFDRDYEPVSAYDRHPLVAWASLSTSGPELRNLLRSHGFTHLVVNARELDRLNRRYRHCVLDLREAQVFREMLATCEAVWSKNGVSVLAL
ncbi:MAG TPA: hypothetical protein PLS53_13000 [Thermoanaerobaculaceae bacterium]|nr:hypothetical protein [Thermoanaerobaculaceae bacterium]